ncbi:endogenous retrovirus group k member 25 pol [Limosa lapponica baueri]|uniref:ribonuclease H n=1 Tax=Limosa lapponica baueri TaxID=1758121 RepID=A0A2I0TFC5_LIMLA|nr:endogenous retrovirus group k member 25 pol [Limosa lapponica baueri]
MLELHYELESKAAKWYSTTDIANAFFSLPLAAECRPQFAFTWRGIRYTWNRLPQGWKHSPAICHGLIQTVLEKAGPPECLQYLDDITVRGNTAKEVFKKGYIQIIKPLYEVTRKNNDFMWGLEQQQAFEQIQQEIVLFCQAALQPRFPKLVALHGVVVTQVQDPALGLVEPHPSGLGLLIQPVQIPLQSLSTLQQINTPTQLGVICKLTEGALDPLVQIIDKDVKENQPKYQALRDTTRDKLPTGFNSIHHHSSQFLTQQRVLPSKPWAASFSRRILWETVAKALLKSR